MYSLAKETNKKKEQHSQQFHLVGLSQSGQFAATFTGSETSYSGALKLIVTCFDFVSTDKQLQKADDRQNYFPVSSFLNLKVDLCLAE